MLVEHIREAAQKRLVTVGQASRVWEVARILTDPQTPLVIVCDSSGVAVGVISRGDIVKALSDCSADSFMKKAEAVMTRCVLSCRLQQPLNEVWKTLNTQAVRCAPILDADGRPQGVVHARDLASALIDEVENEELLLRDYVLGIGYQ